MTAQSKATLAYLGLGALLPVLIQSSASIVCFRRLVGEGFTLGSGIGGRLLNKRSLCNSTHSFHHPHQVYLQDSS